MTRQLWVNELQHKWPDGYWDDWLRADAQRQGRQVLRPEISRTFHFGVRGGASANQFGGLLQKIQLNNETVDWTSQDLSVLSPEDFDRYYWKTIQSAKPVYSLTEALELCKTHHVVLEYQNLEAFRGLASQLELMTDEKAGILRSSYKGVVETRPYGDKLLFLTPPLSDLRKSFEEAALE
jgi:alpha-1,3-mannosyl-glycoprotein beta-1,2-N-acetylglucosaminyltransferase